MQEQQVGASDSVESEDRAPAKTILESMGSLAKEDDAAVETAPKQSRKHKRRLSTESKSFSTNLRAINEAKFFAVRQKRPANCKISVQV